MSGDPPKTDIPPDESNEFDLTEETDPNLGGVRTDLALLRAQLKEHGRSLGEFEAQLGRINQEIESLRQKARRNAHNLKVLAHRLGVELEPKDEQQAAEGQSKASSAEGSPPAEDKEKGK